jgi:glycosyltransferase involved in cell wall biosynthesis
VSHAPGTAPPHEPLRILMVIHTLWSRNLGGPRAQLELAEELRAIGHEVEKLSYEDVFPEAALSEDAGAPRRGRAGTVLRLLRSNRSFAARARAFLRSCPGRFDVVDANQTDLPFTKADLGFTGLLVARSVGLIPSYYEFERMAARRWPEPWTARRAAHTLLTLPATRRRLRDAGRSFRHADLINVSNQDDLAAVSGGMGYGDKVVAFPFGLSAARRQAFAARRAPAAERLASRTVAFIGTWNSRKGARDWPFIVRRVREHVPDARFLFLGTGLGRELVLRDFPVEERHGLEVVSAYESDELPDLLATAAAGAFPGYLEGFGFSVLEKLAAGLPTVTYDAPGPRDTMRRLDHPEMVPPGDLEAFAARLATLLRLTPEAWGERSADSTRAASCFRWEEIARQTAEVYRTRLEALRP